MERDYAYLMDKHKLSKNRVRKRWGKEVKADCTSASRTDFCDRLMELQLEPADWGRIGAIPICGLECNESTKLLWLD